MGKVIHTGEAIIDIVLYVPQFPEPGGDVFADRFEFTAGGGVNVMVAARRAGAEVVYAGPTGSGPLSDKVTEALYAEGIEFETQESESMDVGFSIAVVDSSAERTFISTQGAETHQSVERLRSFNVSPDDIVYVSGYTFANKRSGEALIAWLNELSEDVVVVFDPSPIIADLPIAAWELMVERADIWSLNARETRLGLKRFGISFPVKGGDFGENATASETSAETLTITFAEYVPGIVISRQGGDGALVVQSGQLTRVPGYSVQPVDTNGAGDAHTGYLCALLATGESDLEYVVRLANIAAAIAVTREGPATAPLLAEVQTLAD